MKALVVSAPGVWQLQEIGMPKPGPYDCLVKIDACAICTGTDSDIIRGSFPWLEPHPFVLGHESTGLILETGQRVRHFKPGQRVTRPAAIYPGQTWRGFHSNWGGFAEFGLVRDVEAATQDGVTSPGPSSASRNPLPGEVDKVNAALSINQREILSVVRKMKLSPQSRVVVIGSGYNGLLFALFCKHFGAGRVVLTGNAKFAKRATETYKADRFVDYRSPKVIDLCQVTANGTLTHVIDAIGSTASLEAAHKLLGTITAFGCYGVRDYEKSQPFRQKLSEYYPVIPMDTDEAGCVPEWLQLWRQGFFTGMLDAVMPFAEARSAFERLAKREAVKIVLEM